MAQIKKHYNKKGFVIRKKTIIKKIINLLKKIL